MTLSLLNKVQNIESIKYIAANDNFIIYTSEIKNRFYLKSIDLKRETTRTIFSKKEIIRIISFLNNSMDFIYESNHNGLSNIFLYREGQSFNLTPDINAYFLKLNKLNNTIYLESNERDQRFMDIYKIDLSTKEITLFFYNKSGDIISCISEDGTSIVVNKIDRETNERSLELIKNGGLLKYKLNIKGYPQFFDKESNYLYIHTTIDHNFQYIQKVCLKTMEVIEEYKYNWDIIFSFLSDSNRYLIYVTNENGNYKLNIQDNFSNVILDTKCVPSGTLKSLSLSTDEKSLSILIEKSNSPGDIYHFNLENLTIKKVSNILNNKSKNDLFVEGKPKIYKTRYASFIYGQLYLPQNRGNKLPLMILVHGGPGGQSTLNFDVLIQFLCLNGYAVFAINHRGSSGYGLDYLESINGKHGIEDLKDCIEIKECLKDNPNIDINKAGIIGTSYGAFLAFSAATFYPNEFKFSICLFGVYNWLSTLSNLPKSWENYQDIFFEKIGDPIKDKEHLINISPYFNLKNVVNPVLFVSGGKDIRNNKRELEYIASILSKKGLVKHLHYKDEGHGLNIHKNTMDSYIRINEFIKESLI
ncbi:S9 family peptidase [Salinicoccus sp. ID82-1]|uniref:alpha/beta hydrolase family protein n=1 Tax=Salinicoccus sp. ID82-1 TaxID=2820269 RepID=UPI001F02B634|nr:prolyl oligopeptidase family serine peptidase [Salinicoccus sp. ID82-1]MCG1010924.1 S9 family peptidase [Salinicoccus sp. ID82-1]